MIEAMTQVAVASMLIAVLVWLLALFACESAFVQYRCDGDKICRCESCELNCANCECEDNR